jgi:8-oxo-dGTP diphosphatase
MARAWVLAAGGIVVRREPLPRIAVVRLRKRDEWVLPKGKLDDGETPRTAARREVLEETGHNVTVHEFLGTLVYEAGGRAKVVHYWRMEAGSEQVRELMHDVRAVEWLPLDAAIARLSRASERVFLENVGPIAVSAMARQLKEKAKRREDVDAVPQLPFPEFPPVPQPLELAAMAEPEIALSPDEAEGSEPEALQAGDGEAMPPRHERASFAERVRNWLGRDV